MSDFTFSSLHAGDLQLACELTVHKLCIVYECHRGFPFTCSSEHLWDRVTAASDALWRRTSSISTSRRHLLILHRRASTSELQRSSQFVQFYTCEPFHAGKFVSALIHVTLNS